MDADDLALFERSLRDATDRTTGVALDAALDGLGWHDALADDRRAAVSLLFELQGLTGATSSALGQVMAHALGLADGREGGGSRCFPASAGASPRGSSVGDRLRVDGLAAAGLADRSSALIVASTGGGMTAARRADGFTRTARRCVGIDPDLGLLRVTGDVGPAGPGVDLARRRMGRRPWRSAGWPSPTSWSAHPWPCSSWPASTPGSASSSTGRSPRSRRSATAWPRRWWPSPWPRRCSTRHGSTATPDASAMAKAVAGRQAKTTARHCQQVLAGIGFTIEHPFHRYLRRTLVLDALLGTAASLTTSLGTELIERRQLPPLLPL